MVKNIRRMRTLRCMFHSQTGTSYIDSSILLRTLLMGSGDGLDSKTDEFKTNMLKVLSLRGHFNLQTIGQRSVIGSTGGGDVVTTPNYIPFCIPTLVHLDIRPSVNSAIDLHLILDTAIGLRTLVIDSHGSFVDSNSNYAVNTLQSQSFPSANSLMTLTTSVVGLEHASEAKISHRQAHKSLSCYSLEDSAWFSPTVSASTTAITAQKSCTHLSDLMPKDNKMQHSSTSEEKGYDIAETRNPSSSTQPINILPLELQRDCGRDGGNRSEQSDVRGSLPELSHNDSGIEGEESESTGCVRGGVTVHPSYEADIHDISSVTLSLALPPASLASSTPVATSDFSSKRRQQQWACTKLETLAVRFAHLPWRNGTEPPKRSKETFAFLAGLQKLKRLYIKEGLMLESGREYDALGGLRGLEEVVFTTCYPIPIKPTDMEWIAVAATSPSSSNSISLALKKIVVQRQKSNAALDKEMIRWFNEHGAGVQLSLQLIDCCEEEDRFS
ncbi:hypothetical protein FBU30_005005 [Linnemannia zychae]|nr:hypothetical protein FBU30_005005 [Linnemannia zychae]